MYRIRRRLNIVRRRRRQCMINLLLLTHIMLAITIHRSIWTRTRLASYKIWCTIHVLLIYRSYSWWEEIVLTTFQPYNWMNNFRMEKESFLYLCDQLRPVITCQDTQFCRAVSVERRIAITLWCLATCSEYRTIGHLFGVSRSTVCVIVHDTCNAIVSTLMDCYIKFPEGESLKSA